MTAGFDIAAEAYDRTFTHSLIGGYQRRAVRAKLSAIIEAANAKSILELNCGTGEDAMWLSSLGIDVTATDISDEMLKVAMTKPGSQVIRKADINNIHQVFAGQRFDLIFSNFGGLNCLSPADLECFFKNIPSLLEDGGKLVIVLMPDSTLMEKIYFWLKGDFKSAGRRKYPVLANVDGADIKTYYYNPDHVIKLAPGLRSCQVNPIAILTPPSYLEPKVTNLRFLLKAAARFDTLLSGAGSLAKYSDHYLMSFQKR